MTRFSLSALTLITAVVLAGCNQTDRANIRNAAGNAAAATQNTVQNGAAAVENFATRTGNAISNGVSETDRSLRNDAAGNETAGKPVANETGEKPRPQK